VADPVEPRVVPGEINPERLMSVHQILPASDARVYPVWAVNCSMRVSESVGVEIVRLFARPTCERPLQRVLSERASREGKRGGTCERDYCDPDLVAEHFSCASLWAVG